MDRPKGLDGKVYSQPVSLRQYLGECPRRPFHGIATCHPLQVTGYHKHAAGTDLSRKTNGEGEVRRPCQACLVTGVGEQAGTDDAHGLQPSAGECFNQAQTVPGKGVPTFERHHKLHYLRLDARTWQDAMAELETPAAQS